MKVAGVVVLSTIPFTAVKDIANSPLGEELQRRMEEKKKFYKDNSLKLRALSEKARTESMWYGEDRPRWLGPISYDYPAYLSGELPGDYGFDIGGLSQDPVALQKYFNFEVLHARWAMLAALGALIPELLDLVGAFHSAEPVWWRVGYSKLKIIWFALEFLNFFEMHFYVVGFYVWYVLKCSCGIYKMPYYSEEAGPGMCSEGDTLDYLGIPGLHLAGSQGVVIIAICQALLMVGPEYARYCGIEALEPLGIYLLGDINYPGGMLFDPLNFSKDPNTFEELKVKEIKNGHLAMVAWLGFYAQADLTGKGPVQNLLDHIAHPFQNNLL
ncbi:hypothetical protein CDL12_28369 [Handroanthus impetiginosus]|uniref:Chlorophyll a-b binding protein, chloroplastic n=1 Tax=Handroanthus impetiginosus TaxID=429701 RepID=A0A2G9G1F6_9LAMI|nr:hypothetical protein CDL12_28369 [Handroanthus impetiginosus]